MDCASSGDRIRGLGATSQQVHAAAQKLIALIRQLPEYQDYVRALDAVNADLEVKRLTGLLGRKQRGIDPSGQTLEAVQAQIETLPTFQAYQVAEARIKTLFRAIDEVIGREAGVDFAAHAKPRACG